MSIPETTSSAPQPTATGYPVTLRVEPVIHLTDDELFEVCAMNRELRIERSAAGELLIMTPTGGETSARNSEISLQLGQWARSDGTGRAFDSSGGFILPNGALRSPDASWVALSRLDALTPEQKKKFLPLCPDFVVELRSPSDTVPVLEHKMQEYIANGARLGWIIDPEERRVVVYTPDAPARVLEDPDSVSAEPVLPGFRLALADIWEPGL